MPKNTAKETGDLRTIVLEQSARLDEGERKLEVHGGRIEVLEKNAANMASLPSTVAALGQKVESLGERMTRENDGLREQQKSHLQTLENTIEKKQLQTEDQLEKGLKDLGGRIEDIGQKVGTLVMQDATQSARQNGWRDVAKLTAIIVGGISLLAEATAHLATLIRSLSH